MNKIIMLSTIFGLLSLTDSAWAQNTMNLMEIEEEKVQEEFERQQYSMPLAPTSQTKKDDDDSLFSIFKFSFSQNKKTEEKPQENNEEKKETPLQKLERLAAANNIDSQITLGYMYLYGVDGVEKDFKKSFFYYSKAATLGDNVAINNLGILYYSGIGTTRNLQKAAQCFEKAVASGNKDSILNLAFLYLTGSGISQNTEKAIDLFEQSAEEKNPTASFMLGYAYYKGIHRLIDYNKAFSLFKLASDAGFSDAQYMLAQMYLNGYGVPQNYGNAVKILRKSALQGHIEAMMTLGDILIDEKRYMLDYYSAHIMFNLAAVRGKEGAAEKRDEIQSKLKIEEVLQAQATASSYTEKPSALTKYIFQTFGPDIRSYLDNVQKERKTKK